MPQLTEEDLKNMTPEQIAELQKQNCIFCHIISGKVASKKIYEDDKCIAILDINPSNPGHILLLPKEHYTIMPLIPEDIIGHLFMVAKALSHACLKAFKAEGTNIFVANGLIAGQRAQHFMIHVIPRKENDGVKVFAIPHKKADALQLEQLKKALKEKIDAAFGKKEEVLDLDQQKKLSPEMAAPGKDESKEEKKDEIPAAKPEEKEGSDLPEPKFPGKPGKKSEDGEIDIDKIADMFK